MTDHTAAVYLNIRKPDGKWTFTCPAMSSNHRLNPWLTWSADGSKGRGR